MAQVTRPVTKFSYREYECFPNDGFQHEIVDGEHYMSPAPATKHQKVSRKIHFQLYAQIELKKLGEVYNLVDGRYVDAGTHFKIIAPKSIAGVEVDLVEAWN